MHTQRPGTSHIPERIKRLPEFKKFHGNRNIDQDELVEALELVNTEIHDRYRITNLLGFGGMGTVYKARDMEENRDVAIKIVRKNVLESAGLLSRFDREMMAMVLIKHPNVVEIFDVGQFSGKKFYVMEFLKGVDLKEVLKHEGPLEWDKVKSIMLQVCAALDAAHGYKEYSKEEGREVPMPILHRDLKPDNILLIRKGGQETAKVIDFGMAKFGDGSGGKLTATGIVVGTPSYWAPEQTTGRHDYDSRLDIWALGVIMYELLTGRVPFEGENLGQKIIAINKAVPRSPREHNRDIPESVEKIILKCLEKKPADRYQSTKEIARAISATEGPATYEGSIVSEDVLIELMRDSEPSEPKITGPNLDISIGDIGGSADTDIIDLTDRMSRKPKKSGFFGKLLLTTALLGAAGAAGYYGYKNSDRLRSYYNEQVSRPQASSSGSPQGSASPPSSAAPQRGYMVRLRGPPGAFVVEVTPDNPAGVEIGRIDQDGEFRRRYEDSLEHTLEVRRRGWSSGPIVVSPARTVHNVSSGSRGGGARRTNQDQGGSSVEFGSPELQDDR
jgi:serine/threonine protein kinase